jgi:hypothetical protein
MLDTLVDHAHRVGVAAGARVGLVEHDLMLVPQEVGTGEAGHARSDNRYAHVDRLS